MAEEFDFDQERTEQATQRRRQQAKEKGQVPRSKDLNTAIILLVAGGCFYSFGGYLSRDLFLMLKEGYSLTREQLFSTDAMTSILMSQMIHALHIFIPIGILLVGATILSAFSLGGWVFSTAAFKPQFSRLNPLAGLKRMFSVRGIVELGKSTAKTLVLLAILLSVGWHYLSEYLQLATLPYQLAIYRGFTYLSEAFLLISSGLILIAAIDVPYQLWTHHQKLKMTKQEIKDEYRETEGKPEVKSAIRRAQQEISRRRMMEAVPKADVIITNPTHYSVALKYDQTKSMAPIVVAKGKDQIALRIRELGMKSKVPILETPPLARAIYFSTKLNREIPNELYVAVAHVLAYVFQLKKSGIYEVKDTPDHIKKLEIPESLRRD